MKTLEEIKAFFADDLFATNQGFVIDAVNEDYTQCSVKLNQGHRNAAGNIQGGVIFTLADFAFAVATNHEECSTVTLNSSISFLHAPKGLVLTACARCISKSKRICFYEVSVDDDLGTRVAQVSVTGYIAVK